MNYIEKVAHMLGVELEEEFYLDVNDYMSDIRYRFIDDSLACFQVFDKDTNQWFPSSFLPHIISGRYKIIKLPFKPKYGDKYYYYNDSISYNNVISEEWLNDTTDLAMWAMGNCFKTYEEAKIKGRELMEKLRAEYEGEQDVD